MVAIRKVKSVADADVYILVLCSCEQRGAYKISANLNLKETPNFRFLLPLSTSAFYFCFLLPLSTSAFYFRFLLPLSISTFYFRFLLPLSTSAFSVHWLMLKNKPQSFWLLLLNFLRLENALFLCITYLSLNLIPFSGRSLRDQDSRYSCFIAHPVEVLRLTHPLLSNAIISVTANIVCLAMPVHSIVLLVTGMTAVFNKSRVTVVLDLLLYRIDQTKTKKQKNKKQTKTPLTMVAIHTRYPIADADGLYANPVFVCTINKMPTEETPNFRFLAGEDW